MNGLYNKKLHWAKVLEWSYQGMTLRVMGCEPLMHFQFCERKLAVFTAEHFNSNPV
jgi:hypothetical protein